MQHWGETLKGTTLRTAKGADCLAPLRASEKSLPKNGPDPVLTAVDSYTSGSWPMMITLAKCQPRLYLHRSWAEVHKLALSE